MYNDNILLQSASAKCPDLLPGTEIIPQPCQHLDSIRNSRQKSSALGIDDLLFLTVELVKRRHFHSEPHFFKDERQIEFFFLAEWWQIFLIFITAGNKNLEDAETREAKNAESTLTFIKLITADERFWCNHLHLRNLCTYAYSYIAHVVFT